MAFSANVTRPNNANLHRTLHRFRSIGTSLLSECLRVTYSFGMNTKVTTAKYGGGIMSCHTQRITRPRYGGTLLNQSVIAYHFDNLNTVSAWLTSVTDKTDGQVAPLAIARSNTVARYRRGLKRQLRTMYSYIKYCMRSLNTAASIIDCRFFSARKIRLFGGNLMLCKYSLLLLSNMIYCIPSILAQFDVA